MSKYPEDWIAELLQRNDIVSLVSDYVSLKEKGGRLWGLCPFHGEKTASFSVSPDKQLYYCFGCHAGGNAVHFVMELEKLSYSNAIEFLAKRVNMALPNEINDDELRAMHQLKEQIYEICKCSALFFHEQLLSPAGQAARQYLDRRGIDKNTVVEFGLGYSPDSWDQLTNLLLKKGFSQNAIVSSGVSNKKNDRVYDAYRNRLMFPIIGTYDKVIGFGARTMGDDTPKYLNTSETPVFNKRMNLYGLNLLKSRKIDSLIIVEGYMDVIGLRQHGVNNAVASLGTALTPQQARLAKRYSPNVFIAYDDDLAGQTSMIRGLDILANEGLAVKVIQFETGDDPDEFIRKHGLDAFNEKKAGALTLNAFKIKHLKSKFDLQSEDGVRDYAIEACKFIGSMNAIDQERFYIQLSKETNISVNTLKRQGLNHDKQEKNSIGNYRYNRTKQNVKLSNERINVERSLILGTAASKEQARKLEDNIDQFKHPLHVKLAKMIIEAGGGVQLSKIIADFEPGDADEAAALISAQEPGDIDEAFERLKELTRQETLETLRSELANENTSVEAQMECLKRINELTNNA